MAESGSAGALSSDIVQRLTRWIVRRRKLVVLVATLLGVLAGARTVLTYAALRSDLEELLPVSAPSVTALRELRHRLPGLRHLGIVIDTGSRANLPAAERFVDELALRMQKYPNTLVRAVRKDSHAERQFAETFALQLMEPSDVRRLREAVEARRDWEVSRKMGIDLDEDDEPAPKIPLTELREKYEKRFGKPHITAGDRFVSEDGRTVVVLVQAASHATGYESDARLLERVRGDVASLGFPDRYAKGMRIGYAGDIATRVEETEGLASDLTISGIVVLLLVVGAVVGYYRSGFALLLLGLPLALGTLYSFGLVALPPLNIRYLNSNTAFLGSIVVGNGINSGIILLARYWEARRDGMDVRAGIELAVSATWRPTLAASLAAAAAYGSLVFTDFRGFNQFGWIGGLGMVTCWIANYTVIPALAVLVGERVSMRTLRESTRRSNWQRSILLRPKLVLAVFGLIGMASVIGLSLRRSDWIEYDFSKLRRRDSWTNGERYWGKRMDDALGRYLTPTVVMTDGPEHARDVERRLRQMMDAGKAGGLINNVRSAALWLPPEREQSRSEAIKLSAAVTRRMKQTLSPEDRTLLQTALSPQALSPLAAEDVPDVLVGGLRELGGRMDRNVLVFPKTGAGTWDAARLDAFARDVREAARLGGEQFAVAGSLLLSSDISAAMKADGPRATLLSLCAVLGICWLAFRSRAGPGAAPTRSPRAGSAWRLSFAAMGSLFLGVLLMLGGLAWTGEKLNFSNFVALPITFGIAADYSINVLKRYQTEERLDLDAALSNTGGAVALCSAATIIGFGSLVMAQNRALFSFGVFAIAGEITCLSTAVLALPAAIILADRYRSRSR
ncbi:MAG TPA: MMPL family transporter [Polyangiaceae bacterium]|jgi:hypothetical protein|nr:MMPL family transporter [Polyangiaceae bacterium]